MLIGCESFVDIAHRALSLAKLLFCVLQCCLPGVQIALPPSNLLCELCICRREGGELGLERLDSTGCRCELVGQVSLTIRSDFELGLRLRAPDLTSGPLLSRFILRVFGACKRFARSGDRCVSLRDFGLRLAAAQGERFDPFDGRCLSLSESFDQYPCFGCLARGTLMLPR